MVIRFKKEDIYKKEEEGIYLIHRIACDDDGTPADMRRLFELAPDFDVNTRDSGNSTALHYACQYGTLGKVTVLLGHGADIEALDDRNRTPVFDAAKGATSVLKKLIDLGANLDHSDYSHYLPITIACGVGRVQNTQLLCTYPVDAEIISKGPKSLVSYLVKSCGGRNASNLKLLIRAIAKLDIRFNHKDLDTGKNEVFHLAEANAHYYARHRSSDFVDIMKTMIIAGSNPWEKDKENNSAFFHMNTQEIEQLKPTLKRFLKGQERRVLTSIYTENELKAFMFNQSKYSKAEVLEMLPDGSPAKQAFEEILALPPVMIEQSR